MQRIPDRRFPRTARLLSSADYQCVFKQPHHAGDAYFTVLAHASLCEQPARLGLAISKKQARRAVDRNRLKRLVREVFREQRDSLVGHDFVVMARSVALEQDNRRLRTSLRRLLAKVTGRQHASE